MGGRGSNSKIQFSPISGPTMPIQPDAAPQTVATATAAQTVNNLTFSDTDPSPFHDLYNGRQYYQSQTFGIDTYQALFDYLSDKPLAGSVYSASQTLNHKLRMGLPLTANEQFMAQALQDGMHNIGYNVNLTRYARVDFVQALGVRNFANMTTAQLQKALVGTTFTDRGFVSTSYNHFATAPAGNPFTDKAVKINYKAPAGTQALMPGNGPGGRLGEIVLAPGQKYTVTDVKVHDGKNGTTQKRGRSGSSYYNVIEIDVTIG